MSTYTVTDEENTFICECIKDEIFNHITVSYKKGLPEALARYSFENQKYELFKENNLMESPILLILKYIKSAILMETKPEKRSLFINRFISFLDVFITELERLGFKNPDIFRDCYPAAQKSKEIPQIDQTTSSDNLQFKRPISFNIETREFESNAGNDSCVSFGESYNKIRF